SMAVKGKLEGYPGLDIKTLGGFVVGPASIHPDTGGTYAVDPFAPSILDVAQAPAPLLDAVHRPHPVDTLSAADRVGVMSDEQLTTFLDVLDPCDYGPGKH